MITGFHTILIEVPDIAAAQAECALLLGALQAFDQHARLPLRNVTIELVGGDSPAPRIRGLVLREPDGADDPLPIPGDTRGLTLQQTGAEALGDPGAITATGISGVDHVVLQTADANDCIRLFGEGGLGMRLALDQSVPEWGGRMLFFRCGKLTLEVIHNLEQPPAQDFFWGITYLCPDLEATLANLDRNGVAHSPIRDGRKPGTRVATVKSHNLGIPTLLIEPAG